MLYDDMCTQMSRICRHTFSPIFCRSFCRRCLLFIASFLLPMQLLMRVLLCLPKRLPLPDFRPLLWLLVLKTAGECIYVDLLSVC